MGYSLLAKQMAFRLNAIVLVKVIGFLGRIPLYRILGAEGVGLYQIAYSFYGLIFTAVTGGFPTALALTTSRNRDLGRRMFKVLLYFSLLLGGSLGFFIFLSAPHLANALGNPDLVFAVRCISPAVCVVPLLFVMRGYLQGLEYYRSIAASELVEQAARIAVLLVLTALWSQYGMPAAVGGAVLGAFSGASCALLLLCAVFIYRSNHFTTNFTRKVNVSTNDHPVRITRKDLMLFLGTALAISATRIIVPLSDFLDSLIIPFRLQFSGLTYDEAVSVFGEITGMAATIVYLPTVFTAVLSYTISTKAAADWKDQNKERFVKRSQMAMEMTWLWGIGTAMFLFFYAEPLSLILFDHAGAARGIRYLALIPFFVGNRELTTTLLWCVNLKRVPLNGLLLGVIISLFAGFFLTAIPGFGYAGAAIGVVVLEITAACWNFIALKKQFPSIIQSSAIVAETLVLILVFMLLYWLGRTIDIDFLPKTLHMLGTMALSLIGIVLYIARNKRIKSFV
ncbi:oligosaccharide flippase family protein [Cohnella silvisoli]|uniref:Oligosaccharide flippase family protein n=1 Tax=Cohnella silvisoli TaxID=2873699 RepID=A0ABV1L0Y4_9BACL|nr:oligosaccharide flippase family protein [Cohnella silvisoli]MCD9025348.1 oligosaccharide flippase family protein [Cohnella silvisoli]